MKVLYHYNFWVVFLLSRIATSFIRLSSVHRRSFSQFISSAIPPIEEIDTLMEQIETSYLPKMFGHRSFREGQRETIHSVLSGKSCLAVLPTGAGKSLLYMLPSQLLDGLTIVVSPLLALMRDQVEALRSKNISAVRIDSSMTMQEVKEAAKNVSSGSAKVLYVSPERFNNEAFKRWLSTVNVAMFVVDEAHCISEWGHAFRPDYLRLADFAAITNAKVRLALTATATSRVAADILDKLDIPKEDTVRLPSLRENIDLSVKRYPWPHDGYEERLSGVKSFLSMNGGNRFGPCIIYVSRQKLADRLAADMCAEGYEARAYHAGMTNDDRQEVETWFLSKKLLKIKSPMVVGTIAFGMGVDKSNIRGVIHFDLPRSVEDYVQCFGRAGRDGLPAKCLALLAQSDAPGLRSQIYGTTPSRTVINNVLNALFRSKLFPFTLAAPSAVEARIRASNAAYRREKSSTGSSMAEKENVKKIPFFNDALSGFRSTADPLSLFINYYDLAVRFDVNELQLRLAVSHLIQIGVLVEVTPVYGEYKVGFIDRPALEAFLDSLSTSDVIGNATGENEADEEKQEEEIDENDDIVFDSIDRSARYGAQKRGSGGQLGRPTQKPTLSKWRFLCESIATFLVKEEGKRGRSRKKWHLIDTIDLANTLGVMPLSIVYATSLMCQGGVFADGGQSCIYSRYKLVNLLPIADLSQRVHSHALEIQRRALARADEIVALLNEGSMDNSDALWAQISTYFQDENQDDTLLSSTNTDTGRPVSPVAPAARAFDSGDGATFLPFYEEGWQRVEQLVRSEAIPRKDPFLIARFATGVASPRLVRLGLHRKEAFGAAASCDWTDVVQRCNELCDELNEKSRPHNTNK